MREKNMSCWIITSDAIAIASRLMEQCDDSGVPYTIETMIRICGVSLDEIPEGLTMRELMEAVNNTSK